MNESVVACIAAVAIPGHGRIVLKTVEPASDERVAGLHLVIEEAKGQTRVHGLDPEGKTAELDGELIEIDAVEAALDNVPAEIGAQIVVEVGIADGLGDGLVAQLGCGLPVREADDNASWIRLQAFVVVQAFDQRFCQEPKRGKEKRARAARRVTDLERQNFFRRARHVALVSQFAKSAARDRARKLGTGVKGAGAFSGIAFADQIPFARKDRARHQSSGRLCPSLRRSPVAFRASACLSAS